MASLREIFSVEDPKTGMVLERIDKNFKGVRYTASLVVNDKKYFSGFAYVYSGEIWILLGCPLGDKAECKIRGKSAQVAQHVLFQSFEHEFPRFASGELQRQWMGHRRKLEALRRMVTK